VNGLYRAVEVLRIREGTTEIQQLIIAGELLPRRVLSRSLILN
jgi:alkylation response protein AidB-like acyl-CoA dehydrogenase